MVSFFLLGKKGIEVLCRLDRESIINIDKVIIGTDKNVIQDYSAEIEAFCSKQEIPFEKTNKRNYYNTKYALAIGWRRMIKSNADQQLLVLHDSLLPKLRGFNPLVTALINADREIGVTALFASDEYDKGAIIDVEKVQIEYPLKIKEAIERISICYSNLVNRILSKLNNNQELKGIEQNEKKATYSLWRDKNDYFINWNDAAQKIARFIDAVGFPYEGAKTHFEDRVITLEESIPLEDVKIENRAPGKVIFKKNGCLVVVCGEGLLMITKAVDCNKEILDFNKKFRIKFI